MEREALAFDKVILGKLLWFLFLITKLREAPIAMDCTLRVRLQAQAAIAEANLHLAQANLNIHQYAQNRMRRRRQRRWWYRAWLGPFM